MPGGAARCPLQSRCALSVLAELRNPEHGRRHRWGPTAATDHAHVGQRAIVDTCNGSNVGSNPRLLPAYSYCMPGEVRVPWSPNMPLRPSWRPTRAGFPPKAALAVALALVAFLTSGGLVARADTEVGSWSRTGSLPAGWYGGAAVLLADGRVLAINGTTTKLYDPDSGAWSRGPQLPHEEGKWTLVALAEGGALLFGEIPCDTLGPGEEVECLPSTAVYRLSSDGSEWLPAPSMREARVSPVAVRLADGRVLVAGGFSDECLPLVSEGYSCNPLASAEIYNPASNEWSAATPMPQARGGAVGTVLSDGTVLVVGDGREATRYDPGSGSWSTAGESASKRAGALLFALPGDRAMALGSYLEAGFFGSYGGSGERRTLKCNPVSAELFTAASSGWTDFTPMPAGGEGCVKPHGALLTGSQILLSPEEGYSATPAPSPPYGLLDSEQRCWSTTAIPLEAHIGGEVVALSDGRALVFGGQTTNGHWLSGAEIYTPPGTSTCPSTAHSSPSVTPSPPPVGSSPDLAPRPQRDEVGDRAHHRPRISAAGGASRCRARHARRHHGCPRRRWPSHRHDRAGGGAPVARPGRRR